jgi:hypothetical protein
VTTQPVNQCPGQQRCNDLASELQREGHVTADTAAEDADTGKAERHMIQGVM